MHLMAVNKDFDKKISVGNILVGICLEEAILEGIRRYDFLKGNEDYKFHWANSGRRSLEISLYQRRLKVLGKLLSTMSKDIARIFLR
jgi:CelD/BcsL family acetyltransferase involved in cellulose biosynthesis